MLLGSPSSRIGDLTSACPLPLGPGVVHGPETLITGAPTVLVAGSPAARVGDLAVGAGPPASGAVGSPTVYVAGAPALRVGDPTTHGSTLVVGATTVLVG